MLPGLAGTPPGWLLDRLHAYYTATAAGSTATAAVAAATAGVQQPQPQAPRPLLPSGELAPVGVAGGGARQLVVGVGGGAAVVPAVAAVGLLPLGGECLAPLVSTMFKRTWSPSLLAMQFCGPSKHANLP